MSNSFSSTLCKSCVYSDNCMRDKNLFGDRFIAGNPMIFDNDKLWNEYKEREAAGFPCSNYKDEKTYLNELAKKLGYRLIPDRKHTKFLPCTCGCNRRDHWYRYEPKEGEKVILECQKCGRKVEGISDADAKEKWNKEIEKCLQKKQ